MDYFLDALDFLRSAHSPIWIFVALGVIGVSAGRICTFIKLPAITGQVIVGVLIGEHVLNLFNPESLHGIVGMNDVALGIMTFVVGTHLNYKHLHNAGKRIFILLLFDIAFTFTACFLVIVFFAESTTAIQIALPCAAIAIATAPATVIHMIQEKNAKGALVKTLIGLVALNNVVAILCFEICKLLSSKMLGGDGHLMGQIFHSVILIFDDFLIGFCSGYILSLLTRHRHKIQDLFTYSLLIILLSVGLTHIFKELSFMLICLSAGVAFSNFSYHTKQVMEVYSHVTGLLFAVFFTLAGTHLNPNAVVAAGAAGISFVLARSFGKIASVYCAGRIFKFSKNIRNYLGMALLPQAGLAVGLVINLSSDSSLEAIAPQIAAIVLASVIVNEIIGPFTTGKSFDLANETNQATPRLIDFLQEEYILLPLQATDKWDAIEKMCNFMVKTNHLKSISPKELIKSTVEREKKMSTGVGSNIAIPHAVIPKKERVMGVIGISENPLDFDSFDGSPVHIIILLATPKGKESLHLKIIGAVAAIFGNDEKFQHDIISAHSAEVAYDLLQKKEIRDINYFLEEVTN